ncbi:AAA domain-containing protein [Micromonospora humida]|uniref:AAA domain-containing protein n=1 Tax=Micromonospora humida TaxID=2809018 RepID=UPI0036712271
MVDVWRSTVGGTSTATWGRVGRAHPTEEAGWYSVDLRGSRADVDQIDTLRVAGTAQPKLAEAGYRPLEVMQEGQQLRVRVADFVDLTDAYLWQRRQPPAYLLDRLREVLATIEPVGLAADLAAGRLSPAPAPQLLKRVAGLTPAQCEAYTSCLRPGVRLVWGPPGTGKTWVLSEAIGALIADGKRVLLVSATNIAVDNALAGVMRQRRHRPGDLIRVGPPHLREIAADPDVSLNHLVKTSLAEAEQRRLTLQNGLLALKQTMNDLRTIENLVEDFNPSEYERARAAVDRDRDIPRLAQQLANAGEQITARRRVLAQADTAVREARAAVTETSDSRTALDALDDVREEARLAQQEADRVAVRLLAARAECDRTESDLASAQDGGPWARARNRRQRDRLRSLLQEQRETVETLGAQVQHNQALLARFHRSAEPRVAALTAKVRFSREQIAARGSALAEAQRIHHLAAADLSAAISEHDAAQQRLLAAEGAPRATPAQQTLVERADRHQLPAQHERMQSLRRRAAAEAPTRSRLEKEHAKAHDDYDRLRRDAESTLIRQARVIATTLARLRTAKVLLDGPYDVVLVDEVGAATIPETLLAVSRATTTAVLLGDFMQLGPVLPTPIAKSKRADVQRWLCDDVFGLCGITVAADATAHPGCTVLDEQHRFGLDVMHVANAVAYDGLLRAAPSTRIRDADDPEIVLIDTDRLGDLGTVRATGPAKGWWPAGALISRALAQYHRSRGETIGVITPYNPQADATLEALRDWEEAGSHPTEIGTAHRFQGREFDVVVFDLVEDNARSRWIAQASSSRGGFARDGLRLFNVAVTRTKDRLYLIGSRQRIQQAPPDTVLACIAPLLGKTIRTVRAEHLITAPSVPEPDRPALGEFSSDLADILAQHVRIAEIQDEKTFYETFAEHLGAARHSIWMWATWTANRTKSVAPVLGAAVRRGVKVVVFVRDARDHLQGTDNSQQNLKTLRAAGPTIVEMYKMHQKIVVIDERLVLLGSLNVLSQHQSREVMLVMEGAHFARKILEHENAAQFGQAPPACGACGSTTIALHRTTKGWRWRCYARSLTPRNTRSSTCGWTAEPEGPINEATNQ